MESLCPAAASPDEHVPAADGAGGADATGAREEAAPPAMKRRPATALSPAAVLAQSVTRSRGVAGLAASSSLKPAAVLARALDHPYGGAAVRRTDENSKTRAASNGAAVDGATFWAVWLAHRNDLRRQSLRLSSGNRADAEDALSEAMVKAAQAYTTAVVEQPRAWLHRLVHNACIDRHRRHRRDDLAMRDVAVTGEAAPSAETSAARSPEELLTAAQESEDLRRAMSALPALLAEPLLLHLDDLSDAAIAAKLNVTREVVRKRRQMARDWLRRRIAS